MFVNQDQLFVCTRLFFCCSCVWFAMFCSSGCRTCRLWPCWNVHVFDQASANHKVKHSQCACAILQALSCQTVAIARCVGLSYSLCRYFLSDSSSSKHVCPFLVLCTEVDTLRLQAGLFNQRWHNRPKLPFLSSYFSPLLWYQIWCWEKCSLAWREEAHSSEQEKIHNSLELYIRGFLHIVQSIPPNFLIAGIQA